MQITIDIPQEFISHFEYDKFADSLNRLKHDANLLAGEYEKELMDMLIGAFKNSKVETETEESLNPPHPRWKPKEDEMYYMICGDGTPYLWHWHECCDDGTSVNRYKIGNVFRTKSDAEFAVERLRVLAEMREWAGNWNAYFNLRYEEKRGVDVISQAFPQKSYGEIRFNSREDAINCIKAVGEDRIKKYYFMIPE